MRGISKIFLDAMRKGLENGRNKGRVGWDRHWENTHFPYTPLGPHGILFHGLADEVIELALALQSKDSEAIRKEAADVANFAMFIADIHG